MLGIRRFDGIGLWERLRVNCKGPVMDGERRLLPIIGDDRHRWHVSAVISRKGVDKGSRRGW
jgi:hypothetical protein